MPFIIIEPVFPLAHGDIVETQGRELAKYLLDKYLFLEFEKLVVATDGLDAEIRYIQRLRHLNRLPHLIIADPLRQWRPLKILRVALNQHRVSMQFLSAVNWIFEIIGRVLDLLP